MELEASLTQPGLHESAMYNFERCHLLGYKQHRLVSGQSLRNQVGDRLRFAGAGRSFDHHIVIARASSNRAELARICVYNLKCRFGRKLGIKRHRANVARKSSDLAAGMQDELPN